MYSPGSQILLLVKFEDEIFFRKLSSCFHMMKHQESILTCLYWRSHQSPEEEKKKPQHESHSLCVTVKCVVMPSLTICLKTLESFVLEKVLSGTQRGISPSFELALVRCILAIIAFSSFCSQERTWKFSHLFLSNTTHSMTREMFKHTRRGRMFTVQELEEP